MRQRRGSQAEASPPSPRLSSSLIFLGQRSSQRTRRPPARLRDCDLSAGIQAADATRSPSPPPPSQPAVPQPSATGPIPQSPLPRAQAHSIQQDTANPSDVDESFNDVEEVTGGDGDDPPGLLPVGTDDHDDDDEVPLVQQAPLQPQPQAAAPPPLTIPAATPTAADPDDGSVSQGTQPPTQPNLPIPNFLPTLEEAHQTHIPTHKWPPNSQTRVHQSFNLPLEPSCRAPSRHEGLGDAQYFSPGDFLCNFWSQPW